MQTFTVALEIGSKRRVFAQAIEWIGWCRAGKDEATALNNLLSTAERYAQVAAKADIPFTVPTSLDAFKVVKRIPGTATTDFGALSTLFAADVEPLVEADIERFVSLLTACWASFDNALRNIPTDLHDVKPERGRSPSAIRLHLLEADRMHLSAFGPAFRQPDPTHVAEQEAEIREQIIAELRNLPPNESIPPRKRYGFS